LFGPLFYSTVIAAVLLTVWAAIDAGGPAVDAWLTERSLIRSLRADDARVRAEAASTLMTLGFDSAVPHLIEAARDPRADVRAMACQYLIRAGAKQDVVVPVLVSAASDGDEHVRYESACAFGRLIAPGVIGRGQPIVTMHERMPPDLRSQSIKALRRLLHDQATQTRIAAADALAVFGPDPEVASDLVAATADNNRDLRFAAARALLKVSGANDPYARLTLVALVADLEPIGDRRAILDVILTAGEETQNQAVAALARLIADIDIPILRSDVVDCLLACGPRARAAMPTFERRLNDEDPAERAMAGMAIATIESSETERVIPILLKMIDDLAIAPESRKAALDKIRELKATELVKATPILIRQLGSKSAQVRLTAMEMLGDIIGDTPAAMPAQASSN